MPIAIANAIKWLGIETSCDAVLKFLTHVDLYDHVDGMWPESTRAAFKVLQIKHKLRANFGGKFIDKALAKGQSVILVYTINPISAHAVFIDKIRKDHYRVWNYMDAARPWYPKKMIWKIISKSRRLRGYTHAYVLTRLKPKVKKIYAKK